FAVFRNGELLTFLDAKYRDLWEQSLPREMLYQLALYAAAQGRGNVAILYPCTDFDASEERLRVHDVTTGDVRWTVALRPVHLAKLEALVSAPTSEQRRREREAFA